jgi:hypothetical protein
MSYFNKRYSFLFVKSKNLQLYSYTTCTIVKMYTTVPMAMVHAYIPPRTILTNREISLREQAEVPAKKTNYFLSAPGIEPAAKG